MHVVQPHNYSSTGVDPTVLGVANQIRNLPLKFDTIAGQKERARHLRGQAVFQSGASLLSFYYSRIDGE